MQFAPEFSIAVDNFRSTIASETAKDSNSRYKKVELGNSHEERVPKHLVTLSVS